MNGSQAPAGGWEGWEGVGGGTHVISNDGRGVVQAVVACVRRRLPGHAQARVSRPHARHGGGLRGAARDVLVVPDAGQYWSLSDVLLF